MEKIDPSPEPYSCGLNDDSDYSLIGLSERVFHMDTILYYVIVLFIPDLLAALSKIPLFSSRQVTIAHHVISVVCPAV